VNTPPSIEKKYCLPQKIKEVKQNEKQETDVSPGGGDSAGIAAGERFRR
jgi:hypothetical protein